MYIYLRSTIYLHDVIHYWSIHVNTLRLLLQSLSLFLCSIYRGKPCLFIIIWIKYWCHTKCRYLYVLTIVHNWVCIVDIERFYFQTSNQTCRSHLNLILKSPNLIYNVFNFIVQFEVRKFKIQRFVQSLFIENRQSNPFRFLWP